MSMLEHLLFFQGEDTDEQDEEAPKKFGGRPPAYGTVAPSILAYIKDHPDCTPNEMREELELNRFSVDRALRTLRDKDLAYVSTPSKQHGAIRAPAQWRAK